MSLVGGVGSVGPTWGTVWVATPKLDTATWPGSTPKISSSSQEDLGSMNSQGNIKSPLLHYVFSWLQWVRICKGICVGDTSSYF